MDLNLAPEIPKGNSAKRKLLRKCLTYLASGGNDGGEAHEINVVANALDRSLKIEKDSYLPRDGSSFSVDKWPGYDGLGHQVKAILRDELGADTPSKVTAGGHHEVDLIANSGLATAVIECKSGGAHSDNAQFTSYVELLLTESNTVAEHWFALCYDAGGTPDDLAILRQMHRFFAQIPNLSITAASPILFAPAKAYLANIRYDGNGKVENELPKVFAYENSNPLNPALPPNARGGANGLLASFPNEAEYLDKANEIFRRRFGICFTVLNVPKTTDSKIKTITSSLISDLKERRARHRTPGDSI